MSRLSEFAVLVAALCFAGAAAGAPLSALYVEVPPEQEAIGAVHPPPRQLCAAEGGPNGTTAWSCSNWAGTVRWSPGAVVAPESEAELSAWLRTQAAAAAASGAPRLPLKVVGYAHSWAGLYTPAAGAGGAPGVTLALHRLSGITRVSPTAVEVLAGTSFAALFHELEKRGLALAWPPGGIQGLTVGGAVSVGFHGSQLSVGGVSSVVRALRLLDVDGNAHDLSDATAPEAMRAARMGVGMVGILTRVTLPVTPQFHLRRRRWRVDGGVEALLPDLPRLKAAYDRFHWYAHPATDSAWPMYWEEATAAESAAEGRPCRTAIEQHEDAAEKEFGVDGLPLIMRWDNCSDVSYRSLTHAVDMEAQPLWNGEYYVALDDAGEASAARDVLAAFADVAASRGQAAPSTHLWLHVRYVGGDTLSMLNPCYGHAVCAAFELALVAPSMDAPLPPWEEWSAYFTAMERVLTARGGRPHHAKFYSDDALPSVPGYGLPVAEFMEQAAAFDPHRLLRNERFDKMFLPDTRAARPAVATS
ncbi:Gulo [Scenedesmus sp. PABB004]|nr:Gulo [Scenedesmus sp. PABB004]